MAAPKKEFSLSFADLCMLASNFVVYMTRDSTQFTTRGVNAGAVTAFHALGDAFEVFPSDEYYLADVTGEVVLKYEALTNATALIQLISGFFEQKWGVDSFQYTKLKIGGLTVLSDGYFLVSCRHVVTVATEYLASLTSIGLTQGNIDDLEDEAQTFEDKMNAIVSKSGIRNSKSQERIEKGNELYSFCQQYSKIGKLIWENVDNAKYNNYIITKTHHHGLMKPQNLVAEYVPGPPATVNLTWDAVSNATFYELFVNIANLGSPSGNFNFLNNVATNSAAIPAILHKRNYFKLKAKNDTQTSDYSDEAFVEIS